MRIFKTFSSATICAAALATLGANANAAIVPVVDPYFDMFPAGQTAATYFNFHFCGVGGCSVFADNNVVGWTSSGVFEKGIVSGQYQTNVPQNTTDFNSDPLIDGTTPEPIVLRDVDATISQVVSTTAVAGATYTLDVDLGFEKTNVDLGSVFLIVNGNQVLATPLASYNLTQTQMQESGNWYDFEASYTATNADAGAPIEIVLSSLTHGAGFAMFGNVRLTDSLPTVGAPATPEPATWAMMLIGFGGMAGAAAARRSFRRQNAATAQHA